MLPYLVENDAKCFLHCNLLPLALIPLGITATERAKKKNKNFIMISPSFFKVSFKTVRSITVKSLNKSFLKATTLIGIPPKTEYTILGFCYREQICFVYIGFYVRLAR